MPPWANTDRHKADDSTGDELYIMVLRTNNGKSESSPKVLMGGWGEVHAAAHTRGAGGDFLSFCGTKFVFCRFLYIVFVTL
jgi:hypothetical protein